MPLDFTTQRLNILARQLQWIGMEEANWNGGEENRKQEMGKVTTDKFFM